LNRKVPTLFLDRLRPLQVEILDYFQARVDQEKQNGRKLAYGQRWLLLREARELFGLPAL
jgi:hypothetical protein